MSVLTRVLPHELAAAYRNGSLPPEEASLRAINPPNDTIIAFVLVDWSVHSLRPKRAGARRVRSTREILCATRWGHPTHPVVVDVARHQPLLPTCCQQYGRHLFSILRLAGSLMARPPPLSEQAIPLPIDRGHGVHLFKNWWL